MKSAILKNHILHFAAMFVVLIAGLSFVSCASESGEDQEAAQAPTTWCLPSIRSTSLPPILMTQTRIAKSDAIVLQTIR